MCCRWCQDLHVALLCFTKPAHYRHLVRVTSLPAEPGSVKRSTAPLSSHSSATPAANPGSNTATLATGLKRFGKPLASDHMAGVLVMKREHNNVAGAQYAQQLQFRLRFARAIMQ